MMNISQAVILAGGRGERLRPITDSIPKPMAPVNGIPFLDYLINSIKQVGIKKILILLGYRADKIVERYNFMKNVNIMFSYGDEQDQTGRRVLNAYNQLDENFLLMYGDNFWPIELKEMCSNYESLNVPITTTVFSNKNGTGEYGYENNIFTTKRNVIMYDKKRETKTANGVDIGYFIVSKNILNPHVSENISFEEHILPELIIKNQLGAYITSKQYYYITNVKSLKDFEKVTSINNFQPLPLKQFGV